jgi:O-antigen ligase
MSETTVRRRRAQEPANPRGADSSTLHGARWRFLDGAPLAGLIDASIVLAYMAGVNFVTAPSSELTAWYATTLSAKFLLVLVFWPRRSTLTPAAWLFLGATTAMICTTILAGISTTTPYLAAGGFLAHLALTLLLIDSRRLRSYLTSAIILIAVSAFIHIGLCLAHRMPELWGRYFYFAENQPNLGGEIEAAAALAATAVLSRRLAFPIIIVLMADMALLEARSALLVGIGCIVVLIAFNVRRRLSLRRGFLLVCAGAAAFAGLALLDRSGSVASALSNALLLNDQFRGVSSGASGRSPLWDMGLDLFERSPLYGHSLGYFEDIGYIGPHNLFLYGLAQYGLMSIGFFLAICYAYFVLFTRDRFRFWVLVAALPLFLFNDRIVNLNPYPFLVYVMLVAPIQAQRDPRGGREVAVRSLQRWRFSAAAPVVRMRDAK